jgi:hypothetical protein
LRTHHKVAAARSQPWRGALSRDEVTPLTAGAPQNWYLELARRLC